MTLGATCNAAHAAHVAFMNAHAAHIDKRGIGRCLSRMSRERRAITPHVDVMTCAIAVNGMVRPQALMCEVLGTSTPFLRRPPST